ncbi:hypothetical protein [Cellulomonas sp. FA1]|uniref:hypothetical protein n=1 Tax=Cellulomonas sp. FA1 TaxID=1346710 RepID=UPI000625A5A5|nr:hypothetical protein [Cellulomonas sp. FA1]
MTQLQQSGTFRGSDVDGLDRIVRTMTDAAEFADDVVTALRVLAAALEAMSWTGWAAAFARYLRAVVIPWVQTVAKYLRGFAQVLALISQTQKDTSADTPTVHIPDARFTPVQLPKSSTVNAPVLAAPDPAVRPSQPGGGAAGAGAQVVVPVSIGSITVHVNGAGGGGAGVTTPTAPVARTEPGGGATGSTGVSAGSIATGVVKDPGGTLGQVVGGVVGGAVGHAVGGGTFGERIGAAVADEVAGRISGGSGGASGGGAPVPPAPRRSADPSRRAGPRAAARPSTRVRCPATRRCRPRPWGSAVPRAVPPPAATRAPWRRPGRRRSRRAAAHPSRSRPHRSASPRWAPRASGRCAPTAVRPTASRRTTPRPATTPGPARPW